jgi:uncharacterized RDD family membrane protein YckC
MNARPETTPKSMLGYYAGFATRLLAFICDVFIVSTIILFVSWFTNTTVEMLLGQVLMNSMVDAIPILQALTQVATNPITHSLVSVAFIISYFLFFWTLIGQTPGKYLLGVRIVTPEGNRLKLGRAVLRYLGYYLSALPFGLGFLWILFDDERRAWHDRLAGTCVIYVWDARPDEKFLNHITDELIQRRQALKRFFRRHGSHHDSNP